MKPKPVENKQQLKSNKKAQNRNVSQQKDKIKQEKPGLMVKKNEQILNGKELSTMISSMS